ncbi:hypothetical protein [Nocardia farcinica]
MRLADGSLLRAWLPAVVAMAVLGMHHLVGAALDSTGAADHSRHAAVPAAASAPADLHEVTGFAPDGHRADGFGGPEDAAGPRDGAPGEPAPGEHDGGHDLLHLCAAILTALAGLALVLFGLVGLARDDAVARARRTAPSVARPPPRPTSRRLAALCVLRL